MSPDHSTLTALRQQHPAWRLLAAEHAPLVASFLHRVFITPNVREMAQANLVEALEDTLFGLRERLGDGAYPKAAHEYLNDWAANDKGWLRKYYPPGSDEPHFDLTPATERALSWLVGLSERAFVGTESRLLTLFELLKQMSMGSETDVDARLAELRQRRDEIDAEILKVQGGDMSLLDDTAVKERFQQFTGLARELLTDFREAEHNFRTLDRRVRERIALWDGAKGALLEQITRSGSLAISAVVEKLWDMALISSHLIRLRIVDKRINPYFLALFFMTLPGKMQIQKWSNGGVQPEISQPALKAIVVPILAMAAQLKIRDLILNARKHARKLRARSNGLLEAAKRAAEIAIKQDKAAGKAYLAREGALL